MQVNRILIAIFLSIYTTTSLTSSSMVKFEENSKFVVYNYNNINGINELDLGIEKLEKSVISLNNKLTKITDNVNKKTK